MRLVYFCHPVAGDIVGNLASARRWLRWCYGLGLDAVFVANWLVDCELFDDADPKQRAAGLLRDVAILARCDEVWLCGPVVSRGMRIEANAAHEAGLKVRDFTADRPEAVARDVAVLVRGEWAGR